MQGVSLPTVLVTCITGYQADGDGLGAILNGGGLVSMLEVVVILLISCAYSGIFNGTEMLKELQTKLNQACTRLGRFSVMVIMSLVSAALFCNQTIATLMCSDLLERPYLDTGGSRQELAIDMENSVILIACMVPWCLGCTVPLTFMNASYSSMPYAIYMYAVPLCYWFTKKRWFPAKGR